jgi:hypothetical protein
MFRIRILSGVAATVLALAAAAAAPAQAASARSANSTKHLTVTYRVTGTSTVAKTNSSISLGPATLTTKLFPDATFAGALPLPPAQTSFKLLGLLPVKATVNFIPKGKVTGAIKTVHTRTVVTSAAKDYLRLSDVTVGGIPTSVGDSCQTADPVALSVKTPKGKSFNINKGGKLTGTFAIGDFQNCNGQELLLNQLVPGDGNSITLKLSDPKLIGK